MRGRRTAAPQVHISSHSIISAPPCYRVGVSVKSPPQIPPPHCSSGLLWAITAKRERENESRKYRQWPLQTPSMINVKGFLFLICQSFQRSLTYAYIQPQRFHHSSRWSGTSKPITTRLRWGWCCQSCKLAHLQPFIMHCSREQHVPLRAGRRWTMSCICKCDTLPTDERKYIEIRQVPLLRCFAIHDASLVDSELSCVFSVWIVDTEKLQHCEISD